MLYYFQILTNLNDNTTLIVFSRNIHNNTPRGRIE